MSVVDIKTRIQKTLQAVNGSGVVHTRMRNLRDASDTKEFVKDGRLNFSMISRESAGLTEGSQNQVFNTQTDGIVVHSFMAVKDADETEDIFDALMDAYMDAINTDRRPSSKLGGTVRTAYAPQLRLVDYRMFGVSQALCHHAEIAMRVVWRDLQ